MKSFEIYKKRNALYGDSPDERIANITKVFLDRSLDSSSQIGIVNGIETNVIVNDGKNSTVKTVLFRPDSKFTIGMYFIYKGNTYLIMDFNYSDIYPKAKVTVCNNTLFLKNEPIKTQTGTDRFGRPEYDLVYPPDKPLPCIADNSITTNDSDQPIRLPDNQLQLTIPYTEHPELKEGKKFQMYEREYEISGIDETESINKVGLMIIRAVRE